MVKGDINKINAEFDTNYSHLLARGATLDNPIGILFEAYLLVPCYNFTNCIGSKHDEYLDRNLSSLTQEAMMSMAKCKFDFLKTKGKWGAKSPDDEKIVAMAAEIKSLKGQLKLDPKLSAIAGKGDEGMTRRTRRKRTRRTWRTQRNRRKMRHGRRNQPRRGRARKGRKSENIPLIGASTIWHGPSTSPMIASSGSSTRKNRRRLTRPTLPPSLLWPPRLSIPISLPSWPPWQIWTSANDGSCRHACIIC